MDAYQQEEHGKTSIEEQVARHTLAVVHGSGKQKWQGIATGCAIRWQDSNLILTANHVVCDTDPDDLRFCLPKGVLRRIDRPELLSLPGVPTKSLMPIEQLEIGQPIRDEFFDLAAIPLAVPDERLQFFPLGPGGRSPTIGSPLVFMGFPHDISRLTHEDNRVTFSSIDWSEVAPPINNLDRKFDPDLHFLAPYFVTERYPDAKPHGFSGAGIWAPVRVPPPAVWYPRLELAGVVIGYYPTSRVLQMVRREVLEAFLTNVL